MRKVERKGGKQPSQSNLGATSPSAPEATAKSLRANSTKKGAAQGSFPSDGIGVDSWANVYLMRVPQAKTPQHGHRA